MAPYLSYIVEQDGEMDMQYDSDITQKQPLEVVVSTCDEPLKSMNANQALQVGQTSTDSHEVFPLAYTITFPKLHEDMAKFIYMIYIFFV